jgi:hypothetical protein
MRTDSLDDDKSGLVSMEEFCKLFEPTIIRRSSSAGLPCQLCCSFRPTFLASFDPSTFAHSRCVHAGTMDVDDLMKEVRRDALSYRLLQLTIVPPLPGFYALSCALAGKAVEAVGIALPCLATNTHKHLSLSLAHSLSHKHPQRRLFPEFSWMPSSRGAW